MKIIELIRRNPNVTARELATFLDLSVQGIRWNLAKLRENGRLQRVGPDKGGHW